MPCKADCRQGILDKVFSELVEGDYTFSKLTGDTIMVNSRADNKKSRAENQRLARKAAREMVTRIATSFNGHVTGYINEYSLYDPITITFVPSASYVDHVYNEYNGEINDTGRVVSTDSEAPAKSSDYHGAAKHVSIINTLSSIEPGTKLTQDSGHTNINNYLKEHGIQVISAKQLMDRMISTKSIPISLSPTPSPNSPDIPETKSYGNNNDYEYEELSISIPLDEIGSKQLGVVQAYRNKKDNSLVVLNIIGSDLQSSGNNILNSLGENTRLNRFVIQGLVQKARREGVPDILISPKASVFAPADFSMTRVTDEYGHSWNKIETNKEHGDETLVVPGDNSERRRERAGVAYEKNPRLHRLGGVEAYQDFIDSIPNDTIYELGTRGDEIAFDEHLFNNEIGRYADIGEREGDPREYYFDNIDNLEEAERTTKYEENEEGEEDASFSVVTMPGNEEVAYIQSLTGPETYEDGAFTVTTVQLGSYNRYIQNKRELLAGYKNRINRLTDNLKLLTDVAKRDPQLGMKVTNEMTKVKDQIRRLKETAYGNKYTKKVGLTQEIKDLENDKNKAILSLKPYLARDLERLKALTNSSNPQDLKEAKSLLNFIRLSSEFKIEEAGKVDHPFFTEAEMFGGGDKLLLDPEIVKMFKQWWEDAEQYDSKITFAEKQLIVSTSGNDPLMKATFTNKDTGIQREFSYEELTYKDVGLEDTDFLSAYSMDVTMGIFSHNGLIPQVIFSALANDMEEHLAWSRGVAARMDEMHSKVIDAIKKLEGGKHTLRRSGIIGPRGVSYNIFKQKTKHGYETGRLINRYTEEYDNALAVQQNTLRISVKMANQMPDEQAKAYYLGQAFKQYNKWLRENTIMLDITRLPEVANATEFAEFNATADAAYMAELKAVLGETGYKEEVDKQMTLLREYKSNKQSLINTLLITQGGGTTLNGLNQKVLDEWEARESPVKGSESYHKVNGGQTSINGIVQHPTMRSNIIIPRENTATVTENVSGRYDFADSGNSTEYYNADFKKIEADPDLKAFYELLKEVCEKIYQNTPTEMSKGIAADTLPSLNRTASEMYLSKENGVLRAMFSAIRKMWDDARGKFGVMEESDVADPRRDSKTGEKNYKINSTFLRNNGRRISHRTDVEWQRFRVNWNAYRRQHMNYKGSIDKMNPQTTIDLTSADEGSLRLIAQYANVNMSEDEIARRDLTKLQTRLGGNKVKIGELIQDYSTHLIVQTQSYDLPKMIKYFSNATMMYASRQKMLPTIEILMKHYEKIQAPQKQNTLRRIFSSKDNSFVTFGERRRAKRQMESWFKRAVLGDYGGSGSMGFGVKIYTKAEKQEIRDIEALAAIEKNPHRQADILGLKTGIGKTMTVAALFDNLLSTIRWMKIGFNLSSSITNFFEGITCNMALAATGKYFDEKEIYYGYGILKGSLIRPLPRLLGFEMRRARKMRMLMDRFNVLIDSRNELQKSSQKTLADKWSFLNPYDLNHRVEYYNQSPLMVAMLRTLKIKDAQGNDTNVSVWDAFDSSGKLMQQYDNEHNRRNWTELSGEGYKVFKQNLNSAIGLAHGYGYDEMRGMMAKDNSFGKAVTMFKTWLPSAIYTRLAKRQYNIGLGDDDFKGRYRSHSYTSAAWHGGIVAFGMFGSMGFGIPIAAGVGAGMFMAKINKDKSFYEGIGALRQSVEIVKQLALRAIGIPVNILSGLAVGKQVISMNKGFEKWVGVGKFTKQDAANMRSNMSDIAMQIGVLLMICIAKAAFWDDDDEPDSEDRKMHNVLINKLMQFQNSAAQYVYLPDMFDSVIGNIGFLQWCRDFKDWLDSMGKAQDGLDIDRDGKSRVWARTKKLWLPGLFADPTTLGFGPSAEKVHVESSMQRYFRSYWKKDEIWSEGHRKARTNELMKYYEKQYPDKHIREILVRKVVNAEIPTTATLRKYNMKRETYEQITKRMRLAPK